MKICIIGAGSSYTPELIERFAAMRQVLPVREISMMDIDPVRLDIMHGFCERFAAYLGFDAAINKTADRKQAIGGSTFVVTQIRVGGNAARVGDERIPQSMGLIGQETTGAGGFICGLRTVPAMLEIAEDVAELAPNAWIINYTNPTGLVAEAVCRHTRAHIAGLCAGGLFARNWTSETLNVRPEDVYYDYAGLNHMNFSYNITVNGRLLTQDEFARVAGCVKSVDKSLIIKIGAIPSPYLQYYFHTDKIVRDQKEASKTRAEVVMELEKELFEDFADRSVTSKPESLKKRGGGGYSDVAAQVMGAIYNNRDTWAVVNVPNKGVFPFLPSDAVIETPCLVNAAGIVPVTQKQPPESVRGLISAVKNYETLTVEAAVSGSRDTALLALLAHPLTGDYDTARELLDRLLEANKQYLPNFFGANKT